MHHSLPLQSHVEHVELHSPGPLLRQVGQIANHSHQVQLRLLNGLVCIRGDCVLRALWETTWSVGVAVGVERVLENVIVRSTLEFGEFLALIRILDRLDKLIETRFV